MNDNDKLMMKVMEDLSYIKGAITSDLNTIKEELKNMKGNISEVQQLKHKILNLEEEVKEIKAQRTWRERLITGSIIGIAISAFVWLLTGQKF